MKPLLPLTIAACALLPAAAGAACYTRTYDAAHMAKNPRQQVRSIAVRIVDGPPASASIDAKLRGSPWTWSTAGDCQPLGEGVQCVFAETGGNARFTRIATGLRMEVQGTEGLTLDAEGHEGAGGERRLKNLARFDDGLFLLVPAPDSACQ